MREEPVLFVHLDDDFIPYTIKTQQNLKDCVITGKIVKEADLFEANIRNEVNGLVFVVFECDGSFTKTFL